MTRFASLFPSTEHAEQAYATLTGRMGQMINARILGKEDWLANWDAPTGAAGNKRAKKRAPEFFVDLWLDEESVRYFTEGVQQGGVVLLVTVPEELSRQAVRVVKEHQGKIM